MAARHTAGVADSTSYGVHDRFLTLISRSFKIKRVCFVSVLQSESAKRSRVGADGKCSTDD